MIKIILYCHNTLWRKTKIKYLLLIILNFFTSILQAFGIFTLYPLLVLLTSPNIIFQNNFYIKYFPYKFLSVEKQIFIFSIFFLFLMILSILLTFLSIIFQNYFVNTTVNNIKLNLYKSFIEVDLSKNRLIDKSAITNLLGSEVEKIRVFIDSYLLIITRILLILSFVIILGAFDIYFLISLTILCTLFITIFYFTKSILYKNSLIFSKLNQKISNTNWHMTHAYQDIMLFNLKRKFLSEMDYFNIQMIKLNIKNIFLISFPKHFVEIIIFIAIIFYINSNILTLNVVEVIPSLTVSLYILWRLLPMINLVAKSVSQIKMNQYSFENFKKITNFLEINLLDSKSINQKISFKKNISFNKVKFKYKKNKNNFYFNFKIKKGQRVLIKGVSGSGKSTFFNLASGLMSPNSGSILIDGKNINLNLDSYWKQIGYISQKPYLIKNSVSWNITLKNSLTRSENNRLKKIYKICELSKVVRNYRNLFKTQIFTDALELSGGQKQRLQIARVLFKEPKILFLDETFNALDKKSEDNILKNIKKNYPHLTIFISSHRPIQKFFDKEILIS